MTMRRYEAYKPSGVKWLGEVPSHWEVKRLKQVAIINPSKTETAHIADDQEVTFLPMEAIGETGSLDLSNTRPIRELRNGYSYFADGDVVFAKVTPCLENGKGARIEGLLAGQGFGTTELTVLRAISSTDGQFLWWLTYSRVFRGPAEGEMIGAGGLKRVPDEFAATFPAPWPTPHERRTIAAFLDRETAKIDALVEEQRRLIDLLKEKRQALISHAVTKGLDPAAPMKDSGIEWLGDVPSHWTIAELKYLVSTPIIDGPHETPEKVDNGIPFISAEAISEGRLDFEKKWGHISVNTHEQYSKRYKPQRFDILMVKLGATAGKVAIVETDEEFNTWVPLAGIRVNSKADPYFVLNALRSDCLKVAYELNWTYGTQQTLGLRTISNLNIPLPPHAEQQKIVQHLSMAIPPIESLTIEAETAIALLQERRAALISAAVTGKIDVRGLAPAEQDAA